MQIYNHIYINSSFGYATFTTCICFHIEIPVTIYYTLNRNVSYLAGNQFLPLIQSKHKLSA